MPNLRHPLTPSRGQVIHPTTMHSHTYPDGTAPTRQGGHVEAGGANVHTNRVSGGPISCISGDNMRDYASHLCIGGACGR